MVTGIVSTLLRPLYCCVLDYLLIEFSSREELIQATFITSNDGYDNEDDDDSDYDDVVMNAMMMKIIIVMIIPMMMMMVMMARWCWW